MLTEKWFDVNFALFKKGQVARFPSWLTKKIKYKYQLSRECYCWMEIAAAVN